MQYYINYCMLVEHLYFSLILFCLGWIRQPYTVYKDVSYFSQFFFMFCRRSKTITLKSGSRVKNIKGTGDCEAQGYDSWKKFYKRAGGKKRKWPERCRVSRCTEDATDGAHVKLEHKRKREEWIIPMCSRHNNPSNEQWMTVNANTTAVRAVDTC